MDRYRIPAGSDLDLSTIDPAATHEFDGTADEAKPVFKERRDRLADLQDLLYAQDEHRVLVVLQAIDTGGKDGTVRHVFRKVDPLGIRVQSFKQPVGDELRHDYLWRVHRHVPGDGEFVIFNRSHYEDVLVVRVHGLVDDATVQRRFRHIRDFEQMLVDEGTTIVKLFLHISKDEQKRRLEKRLARPDKHWKFSSADIAERARWDDYQRAFADAISATSTDQAPWYVIPADHKWYRNLVVSRILVDTLEGLGMSYPPAEEGLDQVVVP